MSGLPERSRWRRRLLRRRRVPPAWRRLYRARLGVLAVVGVGFVILGIVLERTDMATPGAALAVASLIAFTRNVDDDRPALLWQARVALGLCAILLVAGVLLAWHFGWVLGAVGLSLLPNEIGVLGRAVDEPS